MGLSAALLLAACGDDDDTASDTTVPAETTVAAPGATTAPSSVETTAPTPVETTEPAPAEPTGSPLVVAALVDVTGPLAGSQAYAPDILQAWADHVNGNGGLNGHPVEIEVFDTKADGAVSQAAVDEIVDLDPELIYLASSSSESAIAESLGQTGIPIVGIGYNPGVWGGNIEAFKLACSTEPGAPVGCALPNAFTITTTFGAVVDEQVLGAIAAGATKVATAACSEIDSCSQAAPVFDATATALGIDNAGLSKVSASAPDYTAECINWIQDGVDFIQLSTSGEVGARLFADCADQGYEGIFGASAGTVSGDLIKVDGITLAGGLNAFPWWVDDAPVVEFRDVVEAAGVSEEGWQNPNATGTWSVMQLWAKALSNTDLTADDEITKVESLAAMYTIEDETLDGLISPVTFTEGQRASHRPCFWPYKLEGGEFTALVGGLQYQCYPPEA